MDGEENVCVSRIELSVIIDALRTYEQTLDLSTNNGQNFIWEKFVWVHLKGVVTFSKNMTQHLNHLLENIDRMILHDLKLTLSKLLFTQQPWVERFGYIVEE